MGVMLWSDLPWAALDAVERQTGHVVAAEAVRAGMTAPLTAVLTTAEGKLFVKGARVDTRAARFIAREAQVNALLPRSFVPGVCWQVTCAGWHLVGFEFVDGGHADLSPGSPDVACALDTLAELGERLTPCPPPGARPLALRWAGAGRWSALADEGRLDPWARKNLAVLEDWDARTPELVAGETLTHTDPNGQNFLMGDRVRVVDWSWPARAAQWCDAAFLVPQLIGWGHTPARAESAASRVPAFATASDEALTAFAVTAAAILEQRRLESPDSAELAALAAARHAWARYRLEEVSG